MTTDDKFMNAVGRLAKDQTVLMIPTKKFDAFCVVAAIQLACRHPEFKGEPRRLVEEWARRVGADLTANDPVLKMNFEMGWRPEFDVPCCRQCGVRLLGSTPRPDSICGLCADDNLNGWR